MLYFIWNMVHTGHNMICLKKHLKEYFVMWQHLHFIWNASKSKNWFFGPFTVWKLVTWFLFEIWIFPKNDPFLEMSHGWANNVSSLFLKEVRVNTVISRSYVSKRINENLWKINENQWKSMKECEVATFILNI